MATKDSASLKKFYDLVFICQIVFLPVFHKVYKFCSDTLFQQIVLVVSAFSAAYSYPLSCREGHYSNYYNYHQTTKLLIALLKLSGDKMVTSKVLVTGGAGFIGSHLVDRLIAEGFEVCVLDNFASGKIQNIAQHQGKPSFHLEKGDIRDLALVKKVVAEVDAVFHEAALIDVFQSTKDPLLFDDVNVDGTLNLLKAGVDAGIKRFIFASSAAVYGNTLPIKKTEEMMFKPNSPYGVSKLASENYLQAFGELYGIETVCLRYFNVYGDRQAYNSSYSGVITTFVNRLLQNLPLTINGDGEQTRDFIHVDDIVAANMLALKAQNVSGEVFNIASGNTVTIKQLASTLQKITNATDSKLRYGDSRQGDIKHISADIQRANQKLGFKPQVSLQDGLQRLVEWYQS